MDLRKASMKLIYIDVKDDGTEVEVGYSVSNLKTSLTDEQIHEVATTYQNLATADFQHYQIVKTFSKSL